MLRIYGFAYMITTIILSIFFFIDNQLLMGIFYLVNIFTGYCFIIVENHNDDVKQYQKDIEELKNKIIILETKNKEEDI